MGGGRSADEVLKLYWEYQRCKDELAQLWKKKHTTAAWFRWAQAGAVDFSCFKSFLSVVPLLHCSKGKEVTEKKKLFSNNVYCKQLFVDSPI